MSESIFYLIPLFFVVALIYSAAGFGGGSSYLAILTLFPITFNTIRSSALLCNILVVSGTMLHWRLNDTWSKKELFRIMILLMLSIPLAFIGGNYVIKEDHFYLLLGFTLVLAAVCMFIMPPGKIDVEKVSKRSSLKDATVGGALGGLAGLVGIGGGIFLSPYLHLTNWDTAKKISVATSIFIFFNSLAGLIGLTSSSALDIDWSLIIPLGLAVLVGGQIGVRLKAERLKNLHIRRITAVIIFIAGLNVLRKFIMI